MSVQIVKHLLEPRHGFTNALLKHTLTLLNPLKFTFLLYPRVIFFFFPKIALLEAVYYTVYTLETMVFDFTVNIYSSHSIKEILITPLSFQDTADRWIFVGLYPFVYISTCRACVCVCEEQ